MSESNEGGDLSSKQDRPGSVLNDEQQRINLARVVQVQNEASAGCHLNDGAHTATDTVVSDLE